MTSLQKLVTMALPLTRDQRPLTRAELLEAASTVLEGEASEHCLAEALCLRQAEAHQLKLETILASIQ